MTIYIIVKYLHYLAIFGIVASLVSEHLLLDKSLTRKEIKRLSVIDGIYGLSAIVVLAAGLTLWLWVGKPGEFYTKNWVFHLKLGLFVLLGLLSIIPTVYFLKQRKGEPGEMVSIPNYIVMLIRLELLILFIIPLLAAAMAQGIGSF